ncbi:MAG: GNAT family N-acetyltransferase [Firmicutes bacterium]|nr:GNAT family N-acetyltransferase [Bacillota bacterium]
MAYNEYIEPIVEGNYSIRLVKNEKELRQYQDLRYKHLLLGHFDPEKAKNADANATDENIGYDKETSQLCAFFRNPETGEEEVVGGYILMRFLHENSFCKATLKYDLSKLLAKHRHEVLETTRAIVHPDHRTGVAMRLLWDGIESYAKKYGARYVMGTMSFLGTDPNKYVEAASYLYHNYRMNEDITVRPLDGENAFYHEIIPQEKLNRSAAVQQLPPLLKGFLWIGAEVGTGFYIDHDLKTVETFALLDMEKYKIHKYTVRRLK